MYACYCPGCSRLLWRSGSILHDDVECPVFECDHCTRKVDLRGEPVELAYTFAVKVKVEPFDPAE
jgi:hypothetical protein